MDNGMEDRNGAADAVNLSPSARPRIGSVHS